MPIHNKSFLDSISLHASTSSEGNTTNQLNNLELSLLRLIGSTNTDKDTARFTHPSFLLSQSQQAPSPVRPLSFFLANPNQKKKLYSEKELEVWQEELTQLNQTSKQNKLTSNIPLHSGWVGYYEYPSSQITAPSSDERKPIAEFYYYPWCICLDHNENKFHLLGSPDKEARAAFDKLTQPISKNKDKDDTSTSLNHSESNQSFSCAKFSPCWSKQDYQAAFISIQEYLKAGDCYQVNLTHPHKAQYQGAAIETLLPLYKSLNPSFGCYFQGQDCELISVSPERFLKIDNKGRLEAKPIKGTIKRSTDPDTDNLLINQLINSSKDKAENLMIVDLLRNDLSISAKAGSVKVDKLFDIESQPNVHHLVSTISAVLAPNTSHIDAINNAFPGGSITGAPKKRAMEIIEELEFEPRSLYCGSFGYYSDSGHSDFNILIRSLEFRNNSVTCWGGGGITIDSEVDDEYEESLTKIRRIMDVVENTGK